MDLGKAWCLSLPYSKLRALSTNGVHVNYVIFIARSLSSLFHSNYALVVFGLSWRHLSLICFCFHAPSFMWSDLSFYDYHPFSVNISICHRVLISTSCYYTIYSLLVVYYCQIHQRQQPVRRDFVQHFFPATIFLFTFRLPLYLLTRSLTI